MPTASLAAAPVAGLPAWLRLEQLGPFDAYAQAMGMVMLTIALLQLLCSFSADARALRIFALLYLLTGIGWLIAHPRAHGGADDVPVFPAMVGVFLVGMNVWGMYEFLGLARRRAPLIALGTLATGAALAWAIVAGWAAAMAVYGVMAGGFALCAWLGVRAARREGNVGHRYIAAAYATFPLLYGAYLAFPAWLAGFELGYYVAVPAMIVGMMILAVSLIRARQRTEAELQRRVAAEDELRQLNSTLEERVAARTGELHDLVAGLQSFNRSVSHDLRGPLSGISGLSQLALQALEQGQVPRAGEHLSVIHAQSALLAGMVHDLLALSQVADAPLRRERLPLRRCVDDALAQLRLDPPMADALQRVHLQLRTLPACEVDADLMRQVFVNLLGNALKFSMARNGASVVGVALHATPRGHAVCIEDNGLGLPAGHEKTLFRPFGRLHGEQVSGIGIGLTIVRRVVEAHGGQVWAEPREGGGARFLFTLDGLNA